MGWRLVVSGANLSYLELVVPPLASWERRGVESSIVNGLIKHTNVMKPPLKKKKRKEWGFESFQVGERVDVSVSAMDVWHPFPYTLPNTHPSSGCS